MNDQLTISREDSDAIFAALRAIARNTKDLAVEGPADEATLLPAASASVTSFRTTST